MRFASWFALLFCLGLLPLRAQFSGRVTGAVVDASGGAVPGAQVDLVLTGGKKPLMTVKTSTDGLFHLIGVRAADYDIVVHAAGFVTTTVREITVDAARETPVPQVKLQLASVTQTVEVVAEAQSVEISNAEVSGTITMDDIRNLPILDRDPLGVLQTQPGVVANGNSATVINGLRTSYSDITLDGINIQDNYIRDNALDYVPNKPAAGPGAADDAGYLQRQRSLLRRRHRDRFFYALRHQSVPRRSATGTTAIMTSPPTTGSITSPASPCRS